MGSAELLDFFLTSRSTCRLLPVVEVPTGRNRMHKPTRAPGQPTIQPGPYACTIPVCICICIRRDPALGTDRPDGRLRGEGRSPSQQQKTQGQDGQAPVHRSSFFQPTPPLEEQAKQPSRQPPTPPTHQPTDTDRVNQCKQALRSMAALIDVCIGSCA